MLTGHMRPRRVPRCVPAEEVAALVITKMRNAGRLYRKTARFASFDGPGDRQAPAAPATTWQAVPALVAAGLPQATRVRGSRQS